MLYIHELLIVTTTKMSFDQFVDNSQSHIVLIIDLLPIVTLYHVGAFSLLIQSEAATFSTCSQTIVTYLLIQHANYCQSNNDILMSNIFKPSVT